MKLLRWHYRALALEKAAERLVFFDESGVNLAMARHYARAPGGERAYGYVPKDWGESVTLLAGIGLRGLVAPLMLRGSLTGDLFEAYVEQFLLREVKQGDILVFDNLAVHKRVSVRTRLEQKGASLLFLPPYSPDLNPIEKAWLKMKTRLRSAAARSYDELEHAVRDAFLALSIHDIQGWFRHCGYSVN